MLPPSCSAVVAMALAQVCSADVFDLPIWFRTTYALVDISVGTPAHSHLLMFDTGSATSFIVDRKCADGDCKNISGFPRNGYDLQASSTGLDLGVYDKINYLGGATGGPATRDVFLVDSTKWNQTFIAANQSSWSFLPADGFLGLAFSTIAEPATKTVVETMLEDGLLDAPKFAVYYGKEFNYTGDKPGEGVLTIGGSKEAKYVDGDMTWLPGRKDNGTVYQLWRSTIRKFEGQRESGQHGYQPFNGSIEWDAGKANGVFDTGAGTLSVPPSAIDAIYHSIGWDYQSIITSRWIPLCTDFNSSWSVTFTFSDDGLQYYNLSLSGEQFARKGFAGRDDACFPPFDKSGSESLFLFGQSFLRLFYIVYDFGANRVEEYKPRIGFGRLKEEYKPPVV